MRQKRQAMVRHLESIWRSPMLFAINFRRKVSRNTKMVLWWKKTNKKICQEQETKTKNVGFHINESYQDPDIWQYIIEPAYWWENADEIDICFGIVCYQHGKSEGYPEIMSFSDLEWRPSKLGIVNIRNADTIVKILYAFLVVGVRNSRYLHGIGGMDISAGLS